MGPATGTYRAVVSRLNANGTVGVTIPRLHANHEFGPCDVLEFPGTPALATEMGGAPPHNHLVRPAAAALKIGDRVLVTLLEGEPNRPVVIGRLAT